MSRRLVTTLVRHMTENGHITNFILGEMKEGRLIGNNLAYEIGRCGPEKPLDMQDFLGNIQINKNSLTSLSRLSKHMKNIKDIEPFAMKYIMENFIKIHDDRIELVDERRYRYGSGFRPGGLPGIF